MRKKYFAYDPKLKTLAAKLRQDMTYSEVKLWKELRDGNMMGYDFDRQKPIGKFIADFYCAELNLVIEVDGVTHDEDIKQIKDEIRQGHLERRGITVIRFWAMDVVRDIQNVSRAIEHWIMDYEERVGVCDKAMKKRMKP